MDMALYRVQEEERTRRVTEPQHKLALRDKNIPLQSKWQPASVGTGKENHFAEHLYQSKTSTLKYEKTVPDIVEQLERNVDLSKSDVLEKEVPSAVSLRYNSEYHIDIIQYLQSIEKDICVTPSIERNYASNHSIVVNWMIKVQHALELPGWVLYTAVGLLDKIITKSSITIKSSELQLLACTTIWLAAKCDNKNKVPTASTFVTLSNYIFPECSILEMEIRILRTVGFEVNDVNPLCFVEYYLHVMEIADNNIYYTCNYLLDLTCVSIKFSMRCPSLLAASAVYSALNLNNRKELWKLVEHNTGFYTSDKLETMSDYMLNKMRLISSESGVFKKYKSSKYNRLSLSLAGK